MVTLIAMRRDNVGRSEGAEENVGSFSRFLRSRLSLSTPFSLSLSLSFPSSRLANRSLVLLACIPERGEKHSQGGHFKFKRVPITPFSERPLDYAGSRTFERPSRNRQRPSSLIPSSSIHWTTLLRVLLVCSSLLSSFFEWATVFPCDR